MSYAENLEEIRKEILMKWNNARFKDHSFYNNKYLWILGVTIYRTLEIGLQDLVLNINSNNDMEYQLFGIPIRIDYDNKYTIKLYKEV